MLSLARYGEPWGSLFWIWLDGCYTNMSPTTFAKQSTELKPLHTYNGLPTENWTTQWLTSGVIFACINFRFGTSVFESMTGLLLNLRHELTAVGVFATGKNPRFGRLWYPMSLHWEYYWRPQVHVAQDLNGSSTGTFNKDTRTLTLHRHSYLSWWLMRSHISRQVALPAILAQIDHATLNTRIVHYLSLNVVNMYLQEIWSYILWYRTRIDKLILSWLMALLDLYGSATFCDQWRGSHLADSNFACLLCYLVSVWSSTFRFVNHEHSINSIISLSWHIMYEHCCLCPASLLALASSYLRVNPLVDAMVEGWQLANACFFVRELNAGVLQTFKFGSKGEEGGRDCVR